VEAPPFCEERLAALRQKHRRPNAQEQHEHREPPPRRSSSVQISPEEISHARVLGLRGKITFDDIKRCYRERMQEYHPDKVSSLGPKLREVAEAESKKINAAYEFFTHKYRRNA
jgi:DnaJ-domain-containing protein 1